MSVCSTTAHFHVAIQRSVQAHSPRIAVSLPGQSAGLRHVEMLPLSRICNPIFMHPDLIENKGRVFGNDGMSISARILSFSSRLIEKRSVLYTLMPFEVLRATSGSQCKSLQGARRHARVALAASRLRRACAMLHSLHEVVTHKPGLTFRLIHCRISCLWCGIRFPIDTGSQPS